MKWPKMTKVQKNCIDGLRRKWHWSSDTNYNRGTMLTRIDQNEGASMTTDISFYVEDGKLYRILKGETRTEVGSEIEVYLTHRIRDKKSGKHKEMQAGFVMSFDELERIYWAFLEKRKALKAAIEKEGQAREEYEDATV